MRKKIARFFHKKAMENQGNPQAEVMPLAYFQYAMQKRGDIHPSFVNISPVKFVKQMFRNFIFQYSMAM